MHNIYLAAVSPDGGGSLTLLFLFFGLSITISFFCSLWEAVLLSVTRPYIETLKKSNPKAGLRFEILKAHINRPLVSILTLNTVANTMGSMKVAAELAKLTNGGFWDTVGGFIMTLSILVGSEITPKNLGARNWKKLAPWVGFCLYWLTRVMTPIVKMMSFLNRGGQSTDTFNREELTMMAEMGKSEGKLKDEEWEILKNLLKMREITVENVMTPRIVVFALKESTTIDEFLKEHGQIPFSRIPVYRENRDDIDGFVLKGEILLAAARDQHTDEIKTWKRDIANISELTNLPEAFEELRHNKHHVAIVHDEFGGVTGLVTMEDIVETLLGLEIVDELDKNDDMRKHARELWEKRSRRKGINLISQPDQKK